MNATVSTAKPPWGQCSACGDLLLMPVLLVTGAPLIILALAPTNVPRGGQHEQPPPPAV